MKCVTITNVRTHAKQLAFVDRMLYANIKTMLLNVLAQLDSKEIQHQNKDAFGFQQLVLRLINVLLVICVSQTNVMFHVKTHYLVP